MTNAEIRIDGFLKNIEKSQKTLERHQARLQKKLAECQKVGVADPDTFDKYGKDRTQEQYWAVCDYEHAKEDIKNTEKKIAEYRERLQYWRDKKKADDEKYNVPNIPAVEEFLARWRVKAEKYYREQVDSLAKWSAEYNEYYRKTMDELEKTYGYRIHRRDKEIDEIKKSKNVTYDYREKYIRKHYTQDVVYLYRSDDLDRDLNKMLDREVQDKRVDLYLRCSAVVGVITDATGLRTGGNGSINGIVIGENGKAKVETIMAGGYAIQCLHYRVLVNPITEKPEQQKQPKSVKKSSGEKNSSYKEKTLQELKEIAEQLGADCKEYSDERIYRMRLVMAIKAKRGE